MIRAGRPESTLEVRATERAALGSFPFTVVGRATQAGQEFMATLVPPPVIVALPFDLKVEPNPISVEQTGKATLTVSAGRKGGYTGRIALELRNLPPQVTARRATIGPGKTNATITLAAAAGAPLGSRGDVDVLGTAPLGNQQAASPAFTVRVQSPPPKPAVKIEPAVVTLKPGGKAMIRVTIERTHFAGPMTITIDGLPSKVSAATTTIPPDRSTGAIELTAAADAAPAKADAVIVAKGAATATATVRVRVEK